MNSDSGRHFWLLIGWLVITMSLWGLAFAPVPEVSPGWLEVARNVCFGMTPSGLPDGGGWLTLTLAPLSMLIALLVGWGRELHEGLRYFLSRPVLKGLLVLLAMGALGQAAWAGYKIQQAKTLEAIPTSWDTSGTMPENYPTSSLVASEFTLVDQHGGQVRLADFRGKKVLITFVFAHCVAMCPGILRQTLGAWKLLKPDEQAQTQLLFVTLDPWRDTPTSLPAVAERWQIPPGARVLSGEVSAVTAVLDAYKMPWQRDEKNGDIAHPALTYLLDSQGRVVYTLQSATSDWLVTALRRIPAP